MPLIAAYPTPGGPQHGIIVEGVLHELQGNLFTAKEFTPGRALLPVGEMQLTAPIWPSKIIAVGRNYAAHAAEHGADIPEEPMLFLKPSSALIGPNVPIELPEGVGRIDHEAELAIIIGKAARRVSREEALSYVLGYTCANDVSARALQKKDGQWGRAKGFDTFCPLGPWINTDLNPLDVAVRARVNGETKQESRTSMMIFDVPTLISFISNIMTLQPGDLILTGTPEGVSELHDGDTVEIEIEGIGVLKNPVQLRR